MSLPLICKCLLHILDLDYDEHLSFILRSADGVRNKEYVFHFGNTYDMIIMLQKTFLEPQSRACVKEKKLRRSISSLHMKDWHAWVCTGFDTKEDFDTCQDKLKELKDSLTDFLKPKSIRI